MAKFQINTFGGMIPIIPDDRLQDSNSTIAKNVNLNNGFLKLCNGFKSVNNIDYKTEYKNAKTIYKYNDYWLFWSQALKVIGSPLQADKYGRIYISAKSDKEYPTVTCKDWITSNGEPKTKVLGLPSPPEIKIESIKYVNDTNKTELLITGDKVTDYVYQSELALKTLALVDSDTIEDDLTHYYVATYVTDWGEESQPSDPVQMETVLPTWSSRLRVNYYDVSLSAYGITKMRIYRSVTSTEQAEFLYIGEVEINPDTSFTHFDDTSDNLGGTTLSTENYDRPAKGLKGLTQMANGVVAGYFGRTVCFSEPYIPYAFPIEYQINTEDNVVGLASMGTNLVVCTQGTPYLFQGTTSSTMTNARIPVQQACLSSRSIVALDNVVIYASPDGLVGVSSNGSVDIMTKSIISREQWQLEFKPESIIATYYDGNYIFYSNQKLYMFNTNGLIDITPRYLNDEDIEISENNIFSFYWDKLKDDLYIGAYNNVYKFDVIKDVLFKSIGEWQSKICRLPNTSFTVAKIVGKVLEDNGELSITVYCDNKEIIKHQGLPSRIINRALRLPIRRGDEWQLKITMINERPNVEITSCCVCGSMQEINK